MQAVRGPQPRRLAPTGKSPKSCQPLAAKIFRFTRILIYVICPASSPRRDVSRSSRCVGAGYDGRCGVRRVSLPARRNATAYGEIVWSWRRDPGATLAVTPAGNGGKKGRFPRESTYKPTNIARGKPGCLGCTCSLARVLRHAGRPCAPAHGIYGRSRRPAFPAPLFQERSNEIVKPGHIAPRERERMPDMPRLID
jgi:hypothetical protein